MQAKYLFYDEDPFGRITDVHWKKKKPTDEDCPPPRAARPHYSGFYGFGNAVATVEEPIIPFGEHQYPGCVGWSSWSSNVIAGHDCGGIYTYEYIPLSWSEGAYLTGNAYTSSLQLLQGNIAFTNNELWYGPFSEGQQPQLPAISWTVPMSGGETYLGCFGTQNIFAPWVPLVLRLNFVWSQAPSPLAGDPALGISFVPLVPHTR